ncbi:MAG: glycosyltransferase family 1 protein, partial [Verrucomicrobia bacterium]
PDAPWLCVGSIEPRKNHAALLDAYLTYRGLVEEPRPLVIAGGRGWSSQAIHARFDALRDRGVRYLGYVPDEDLPDLYGRAFALIQPSWHEGFGLPVVEAMGFGTPVLCSDIPTLREVAAPAALFFPPHSPDHLAQLMARLEEDPALVSDLSRRSADRAGAFSWQKTAAAAVAFYRHICETVPPLR